MLSVLVHRNRDLRRLTTGRPLAQILLEMVVASLACLYLAGCLTDAHREYLFRHYFVF